MTGVVPRWLSVLSVILAIALVLELLSPGRDGAEPRAAALRPAIVSSIDPGAVDRHSLDESSAHIRARPLFAATRRPSPVISLHKAATAVPRLSAIIIGQSEKLAIFEGAAGDKPIIAKQGETVAGYVLQSIAPGQATLVGPEGPMPMHLAFDTAPAEVPTAPKLVAVALPRLPIDGSRQTLLDRVLNRP